MTNLDYIISESIDSYLNSNLILEKKKTKKKKRNEDTNDKKDKRWRKKAIKTKSGARKDFDVENEKKYNRNVDDMEQSSVKNILKNGFINIKKVAEKLYPDHTPEGAQSQLNKKLRGDRSDSGSIYKLKNKEVKKLRQIIANYLKV